MLSHLIHGLCACIYFSCLIALAKAFNTRLNTGGESEHPCPLSDLREIAVNLPLLNIMLAVKCLYSFIKFSSILLSVSFIMKKC